MAGPKAGGARRGVRAAALASGAGMTASLRSPLFKRIQAALSNRACQIRLRTHLNFLGPPHRRAPYLDHRPDGECVRDRTLDRWWWPSKTSLCGRGASRSFALIHSVPLLSFDAATASKRIHLQLHACLQIRAEAPGFVDSTLDKAQLPDTVMMHRSVQIFCEGPAWRCAHFPRVPEQCAA